MKRTEIEKIVQARIEDAEVLYQASRYDGSVYLCGYAVELGLKARICRTLQWDEYPTSGTYKTFKTHDLDVLIHLTGMEDKVKLNTWQHGQSLPSGTLKPVIIQLVTLRKLMPKKCSMLQRSFWNSYERTS